MSFAEATALVVAVVWSASLIMRRKTIERHSLVVGAVGITLLAVYSTGVLSSLPNLENALEDLASVLGQWTYLLVGLMAFLETGAFIGLVAPGEATVIVGGVVAGQGEIEINLLIGIVWLAAFAGDSASFFLGSRLGRDFMLKHGPRFKITEERLVQVETYMQHHGGKTILIGRFIGLVRAIAPFIAGTSKMPYRRFVPYDILGSGLWATACCLVGYVFSQSIDKVITYAQRGTLIFGWTVGTMFVTIYLFRRFRQLEEREKFSRWLDSHQDRRFAGPVIRMLRSFSVRVLLPVAQLVAPRLRFAIDRFTPGGLGIEFTTAAAVTAVSSFGFFFYAAEAKDGTNAVTVDSTNQSAFDVVNRVQTDWLTELSKLFTHLGDFAVVAAVVLIATGFCIWRRRVPEALVILLSFILTVAAVRLTKTVVDLPRPPGGMVPVSGSSFPSAHAAYAISFVVIALALERIGGWIGRLTIFVTALAIAISVALSRVYLHVHYLSDAIAGQALAATVAGVVTCVALVVVHIRNGRGADQAATPDPAGNVA